MTKKLEAKTEWNDKENFVVDSTKYGKEDMEYVDKAINETEAVNLSFPPKQVVLAVVGCGCTNSKVMLHELVKEGRYDVYPVCCKVKETKVVNAGEACIEFAKRYGLEDKVIMVELEGKKYSDCDDTRKFVVKAVEQAVTKTGVRPNFVYLPWTNDDINTKGQEIIETQIAVRAKGFEIGLFPFNTVVAFEGHGADTIEKKLKEYGLE